MGFSKWLIFLIRIYFIFVFVFFFNQKLYVVCTFLYYAMYIPN